jgi:hypothetical protein
VIGEAGHASSRADEVRRVVGIGALAVAIVAAVGDQGSTGETVLATIPVAALSLWAARPSVPLAAVSLAVVVPVVVAQRSGGLEPLMFEASLLAFVVGRWSPSPASAAAP